MDSSPYTKVCCAVCGADQPRRKYTIKKWKIVTCSRCGHVYLNPRPKDTALFALYDSDYFVGKGFDETVDYKEKVAQPNAHDILEARWFLREIKKYVPSGVLLDVGCSYGFFLTQARESGFTVFGNDISPSVAPYVRNELGIPISIGNLRTAEKKANKYDVITMAEVIEHLPDPTDTLRHCYSLLRENGIIVIQTGNIKSSAARFHGKKWDYFTLPGHIHYFSPKTLSRVVRDAGFSLIKIIPPHDFEDTKVFRKLLRPLGITKKSAICWPLYAFAKFFMDTYDTLRSPGLIVFARKNTAKKQSKRTK